MSAADELAERALASAHRAALDISRSVLQTGSDVIADAQALLSQQMDHVPLPGAVKQSETWERIAALQLLLAAQCLAPVSDDDTDGTDDTDSKHGLERLEYDGWRALDAGDLDAAIAIGQSLLEAATDEEDWNFGNLIHDGHLMIGFARLAANDLASASDELRAAGDTPGSPQLDSFGPDLSLAWELLRRGEQEAVIDYLKSVSRFWSPSSVHRK